MINGSLVGMVSICAGADRYYPWAACVISGILKFSIFSFELKLPEPPLPKEIYKCFLISFLYCLERIFQLLSIKTFLIKTVARTHLLCGCLPSFKLFDLFKITSSFVFRNSWMLLCDCI